MRKKDSDGGLFDGEQSESIPSNERDDEYDGKLPPGGDLSLNGESPQAIANACVDSSASDQGDTDYDDGDSENQLFDEDDKPVPPQAFAAFNMKSDLRVFLKMLDRAAEPVPLSDLARRRRGDRAARRQLAQGGFAIAVAPTKGFVKTVTPEGGLSLILSGVAPMEGTDTSACE
jgi:hypothetical protein